MVIGKKVNNNKSLRKCVKPQGFVNVAVRLPENQGTKYGKQGSHLEELSVYFDY